MKLQNTFVGSKMNTDTDERLLPKGQYPNAENIRVANSEGSDVGAIENVKGNEKLTSLNLSNAETIGAFADGASQKLYWFITSDAKDLVVEYDTNNAQTNILLESSKPDGVLNFNKNNLITGIVKIVNGDSNKDLIIWTDDLNPPRVINIERAKTYGVDGFIEQDISLVKRSPRYAPDVVLTYTPTTTENHLENKFLSFAYRYKYLDGGNSPLSSFTNYAFSPSEFDLDFQTMENKGMSNNFNAVRIDFNTGDKRVTDIELVFKESGSNTVYLIESFNKENEVWGNNEVQSFVFSNNKSLTALPEDELFRVFDNIPRQAKALELIGSRIAFGNYLEQYDLTNIYGEDINIDYSLSLTSLDLSGEELPVTIGDLVISDDILTLDLTGITLQRNNRVTISVVLDNIVYTGSFEETFDFILNEDYVDAQALAESEDFIYFVETLMTAAFEDGYSVTPPADSIIEEVQPFVIESSTSTSITISSPSVVFRVDDTPADDTDNPSNTHLETADFQYENDTNAFYKEVAVDSSLKTNRSYEVGIIYIDADGRTTTVLTDEDNTINVDQKFSVNQNKIVANINHNPPYWADRYKLVVKQNKGNYQTIYTNLFYEDGLFRWVKLEGANINKVKQGDTLIVKSDLGGVVEDPIKVRVLEIVTKDKDFIEGNEDSDGSEIIEESGVYMKIKPTGFDMNYTNSTARTYEGGSHLRYPVPTYTNPDFGTTVEDTFTPYPLNAGSKVRLKFNFSAKGSISYSAEYDKSFRVNGNYDSIQDWFEAEVEDLGSFGETYCRGGYGTGYGFTADGSQFYIWAHRDGTASRNIGTSLRIEVLSSDGIVIFETEPEDKGVEAFYETAQTFDIVDNFHKGNIQDQDVDTPTAIIELDFFNCYVQGNGAESYRYLDAFNVGTSEDGEQLLANYLDIDLRPSVTNIEKYREVRRYADITYSETYNENSNLNGLGVFNLAKANYKEDIEKKYGFIQKLYARDTNLVVFQEDKVSYVLFGKDVLSNADGTVNVTSIEDVLGQQVMYTGEYGISRNPESFAFDANNIYFIDSKRGCVCRLGAQGITEISMAGMRTFFKDDFKNAIDNKKLGSYDPYLDQYVVHSSSNLLVQPASIDCSETFYRGGVKGTYIIEIDFGILTGEAGFSYKTNNPIQATLSYDGVITDLGTLNGTGTHTFTKAESLPRIATLTVTADVCDTNFEIAGNCITPNELNVISIILNNEGDENRTAKSRYKWSNDSYSSPFTTFDNVFNEDEIELFENVAANEGSVKVPLTGSTVRIENYLGFTQTMQWVDGENKLGYLISNTLYTEAELETLITAATFPTETLVEGGDGSATRYIEFDYDRNSNEQYLYLIWDYRDEEVVINENTIIRIYFDSSGSMNTTLTPLQTMRDTLLKDRLLPLYNNDSDLYDANVTVISDATERTLNMLNIGGDTPEGNVISIVFQDEANPIYQGAPFDNSVRTVQYDTDIATFRGRLASFSPSYYRGIIFQVDESGGLFNFRSFIQAVQTGAGNYSGVNGLSDRTEINYKYNIQDGGTASYYLNEIVTALEELGYEL